MALYWSIKDTAKEVDQIRVVIAEDHPGVLAGIKGLLYREADIAVVGDAQDGGEAIKLTRETRPDILLLDFEMPVMRGDEVLRLLCQKDCEVKVLVVSSYADRYFVEAVIEIGASGYITKNEAGDLLADAIRKIDAGDEKWLSPQAAFPKALKPEQLNEMISRTELKIMRMLSAGSDEKQIEERMSVDAERLNNILQLLMLKFSLQAIEQLREVGKKIYHK